MPDHITLQKEKVPITPTAYNLDDLLKDKTSRACHVLPTWVILDHYVYSSRSYGPCLNILRS